MKWFFIVFTVLFSCSSSDKHDACWEFYHQLSENMTQADCELIYGASIRMDTIYFDKNDLYNNSPPFVSLSAYYHCPCGKDKTYIGYRMNESNTSGHYLIEQSRGHIYEKKPFNPKRKYWGMDSY